MRADRQFRNFTEMEKIHSGKSTAANFTSTNFGRGSEGPWPNCGSKIRSQNPRDAKKRTLHTSCTHAAQGGEPTAGPADPPDPGDPEISRNPFAQS